MLDDPKYCTDTDFCVSLISTLKLFFNIGTEQENFLGDLSGYVDTNNEKKNHKYIAK